MRNCYICKACEYYLEDDDYCEYHGEILSESDEDAQACGAYDKKQD